MKNNLTITIKVKVLDYWLVDNYKLGASSTLYMLVKICNKLHLMEKEIK